MTRPPTLGTGAVVWHPDRPLEHFGNVGDVAYYSPPSPIVHTAQSAKP